jgi:hypothetical protein
MASCGTRAGFAQYLKVKDVGVNDRGDGFEKKMVVQYLKKI